MLLTLRGVARDHHVTWSHTYEQHEISGTGKKPKIRGITVPIAQDKFFYKYHVFFFVFFKSVTHCRKSFLINKRKGAFLSEVWWLSGQCH